MSAGGEGQSSSRRRRRHNNEDDEGGVMPIGFPTDEALDSGAFDPVVYLNTVFPNEAALVNLDVIATKMKHKIRVLDEDVLDAIRTQAQTGNQGQRDLDEGKRAIQDLFKKIVDIKRKAGESERMVQEICRDITRLDHAKKNLMSTITTLNNLRLLVNGVDKLKEYADQKQYRQVGDLLGACSSISVAFGEGHNNPSIVSIRSIIDSTQVTLKRQIREDFNKAMFYESEDVLRNKESLKAACYCAESLGDDFNGELRSMYFNRTLMLYQQEFRTGSVEAGLPNALKRFEFLDKYLTEYMETWDLIFPKPWKMNERMAERLCETTRSDFVLLLEQLDDSTVPAALEVLTLTRKIEKKLSVLFKYERRKTEADNDDDDEGSDDELPPGLSPSEQIRYRYERHARREAKRRERMQTDTVWVEAEQFRGIISSCFSPYMTHYISAENKNLTELLRQFRSDEKWNAPLDMEDSELVPWAKGVYDGVTVIVVYFSKSAKRCAGVSRGQPYFDLHRTFKAQLQVLASVLTEQLPHNAVEVTAEDNLLTSTLDSKPKDIYKIARIISSATYLVGAIQEMQAVMEKQVDPAFASDIDFGDETSQLNTLIALSVMILVIITISKAEPALQAMGKTKWETWDRANPPHNLVDQMIEAIQGDVPILRSILIDIHFKRFCDKFATVIIPRYCLAIFSAKKINNAAVEQLMVDTAEFRNHMANVVIMGTSETSAHKSYNAIVNNELGRLEKLLKIMVMDDRNLFESFNALIPDGTQQELKRIMELKGMKKSVIDEILAKFLMTDDAATTYATVRAIEKSRVRGADLIGAVSDASEVLIGAGKTLGAGTANVIAGSGTFFKTGLVGARAVAAFAGPVRGTTTATDAKAGGGGGGGAGGSGGR